MTEQEKQAMIQAAQEKVKNAHERNSEKLNITNNYYGNIGQHIDFIENQVVRFDKDMNMVVDTAATSLPQPTEETVNEAAEGGLPFSIFSCQCSKEEHDDIILDLTYLASKNKSSAIMQVFKKHKKVLKIDRVSNNELLTFLKSLYPGTELTIDALRVARNRLLF